MLNCHQVGDYRETKNKSANLNKGEPSLEKELTQLPSVTDVIETEQAQIGDGIQVQINDTEFDPTLRQERDDSTSESEGETSESSSSEASSTESEVERVKGKPGRGKRRKKRSKRRLSSSEETSETDSDDYHEKLLHDNPGLQAYIAKRKDRQRRAKENRARRKKKRSKNRPKGKVVNSPSGSTIYTRALPRLSDKIHSPSVSVGKGRGGASSNEILTKGLQRMQLANKDYSVRSTESTSEDSSDPGTDVDDQDSREHDRALHKAAEEMIINSEKFKASAVVPPPGTVEKYDYNNDADFMVSTCHVDTSIADKAKKGCFVELEKLLNKSLKDANPRTSDKYKLDLVNKEGQSYLVASAPEKELKITGYRRWEQAFKVYMIFFTESNPTRAAEILAYADIISNAGSEFHLGKCGEL